MDLELLQQADFCLSKCGKPVAPPGLSVLYIPRGVPIQIQANATSQQTIAREVTGDTDWELRAISMSVSSTVSCYFQIQLPDGSFLFNQLLDISQVAGYGSARYVFSKPHLCPPGTRFVLTFDTTITSAATVQPIMILFEGCDRYLFKNGQLARCPEAFAARLPRIFGQGNENILAPCWQQGFTPEPPKGYKFTPYSPVAVPYGQGGTVLINGQPPFTTVALAGPFTATAAAQIDQANDLEVQRFLFDVQADSTVTAGTFLCRIRNSSGYSLCDDYFDVQQYIGSSPFVKRWRVRAGDTIYFDLNLVDSAGTGNMYFRAFAEGVRRIAA